jgi:orotidine-5'-phosphate decarboxylase
VNRQQLIQRIFEQKSFLCVGLDTDIEKIPPHLVAHPDALFEFNKAIIEATLPYCVAYKINTAFYEAYGTMGWDVMKRTLEQIPNTHFTIADAKRGDIGNTSNMYAKAFFETLPFDSITLAPYMGRDSLAPFFSYPNKWGIVLALTSNEGSADFEQQQIGNEKLYERVMKTMSDLAGPDKLMFVTGATKAPLLAELRKIAPDHFFLVPGIGAQGGSLEEVIKYGMNKDCGLLVNASRSIIYASVGTDFALAAANEAKALADKMKQLAFSELSNREL